jgi:hypothetical protein
MNSRVSKEFESSLAHPMTLPPEVGRMTALQRMVLHSLALIDFACIFDKEKILVLLQMKSFKRFYRKKYTQLRPSEGELHKSSF